MSRERGLAEAFVAVADTLVADYDVVDLCHRLVDHCIELLAVDAAGLLLADQRGGLQVLASSTERTRLLELFQLQNSEGPCLECFTTGAPVLVADLPAAADRWPRFAAEAEREGFQSVHALPLRLRSETIGAMNLFGAQLGRLPEDDLRIGQALADVATIAILQERTVHRGELLTGQLQAALTSRVIIEQAKGVLAEHGTLDMDTAFARLRRHARDHNRRLSELAREIVDGRADIAQVLDAGRRQRVSPT